MTRPDRKPLPTTDRYDGMRDFTRTPEPAGDAKPRRKPKGGSKVGGEAIFVVQKHDASRLHWDFRLEHDGVLWSWAVPKGPSLDPSHKRLAMHVEDHPLDYAGFEGVIPAGNYGAGTVEIWDRGTWRAVADDAAAALAKGELKIELSGTRLRGRFVLVRLKPRPREKAESWLLIKEHDQHEQADADATMLETMPLDLTPQKQAKPAGDPLPETQAPQLAKLVASPPSGAGWISEIKFDGYRMLCRKEGDAVRIITRNGLDWTDRLPTLARAVAGLDAETLLLDGELVVLDAKGISSFSRLQAAFSSKKTERTVFYAFDLLHQDGRDLRPAKLSERRQALRTLLGDGSGPIRFSAHLESSAERVRHEACAIGLEGIVCKRIDAPYRAGRGDDWVKVKCENREEFVVLGFTPPAGSRKGFGALQLGYQAPNGHMQFAGGCGTGFTAAMLKQLAARLDRLRADAPAGLRTTEPPPRDIVWVRPELVVEVKHAGFSGGGMLRHASFQGLREDKPAAEVIRALPDADVPRREIKARTSSVVVAKRSERGADEIEGQRVTHPDRALWPADANGPAITKRDLAVYWQQVMQHAAPSLETGLLGRPLAFVRCPDGIGGEQFFQKHLGRGMPPALREGKADDGPFVAVDDLTGLIGCAQIAAIELHSWGAPGADPLHADRLVFDLDPGEGVEMATIAAAARDVKQRLEALGLTAFCRTSGGKGLHVLTPIRTDAGWDTVRAWCRDFAERMAADAPDAYVAHVAKRDRTGRILIDWLRNGLGSTAVASFSPRARPGAGVAMPLAWRAVTAALDPSDYTVRTVPDLLRRRKTDPWADFDAKAQDLPTLEPRKKAKRNG